MTSQLEISRGRRLRFGLVTSSRRPKRTITVKLLSLIHELKLKVAAVLSFSTFVTDFLIVLQTLLVLSNFILNTEQHYRYP